MRLSLLIFMLPGIGMRIIPTRVKITIVLALTILLLPTVLGKEGDGEVALIPLLFGEAFVGFYLGFSIRVFVFVLSLVGAILAQSLSLSQIFGAGISEDTNTTISTLLTIAGATLFLTLDLDVVSFALLVESYRLFPMGDVFIDSTTQDVAQQVLKACGEGFALAISLAFPFLVLNLAYNTLLGVLNRAMPQLMVTFVGLPAITLSGIFLLIATSGGILLLWLDAVQAGFGEILP
ncbi:MAG: flagellar biosynthetic protein FliR [Pseudomonadota bacterium]